MLKHLLVLLFLLVSLAGQAFAVLDSIPKQDSTEIKKDSLLVGYFNLHTFNPLGQKYKVFENALKNVQDYFPYRFGGNSNLLTLHPFYTKVVTKGFYNRSDLTDVFNFNQDSARYFKTRVPYADLLLVVASQREQFFKFTYSQNINKALNFSASMARLTAEGHFIKQKISATDFNTSFNYNSTSHRYGFLINASYRNIKAPENGGIQNSQDSLFKAGIRKQTLLVNLENANSKRINRYIYMQHFVKLGKKEVIQLNDTTKKVIIHGTSFLSYTFNGDQDWYLFNELQPSKVYYKQILRNINETADSTGQFKINHELAWRTPAGRSLGTFKPIGLLFAINKEYIKFSQVGYNSPVTASDSLQGKKYKTGFHIPVENFFVVGQLSGIHGVNPSTFNWSITTKYYVDGFQAGDHLIKLAATKLFSASIGSINASYELNKTTPAFVYNRYRSNNFSWNTIIDKTSETSMAINYFNEKFKISLGLSSIKLTNYAYLERGLDSLISSKQYVTPIKVNTISIGKNFKFWKFGFDNKFYYQLLSDTNVLSLPKYIAQSSLYFTSNVLNRVAEIQTGLSVVYTSDYYANAYMPALGMYYMQREQKVGNYPYFDFFLNVKVQAIRFFFKVEHANSGLMGSSYYLMPNYPAFERVIKFGVRWTFFD